MAQVTIVFDVGSTPSTAVTFAPAAGWTLNSSSGHYANNSGTLAAGTPIGTLTVAPAGWSGSVTTLVTPTGAVTVTGGGTTWQLAVGPGGWPIGSYTIVATSTP